MFTEIRNNSGEKLDFTYAAPSDENARESLVILAHGVTGNKDRPLLVGCDEALQAAGYHTLRFSFAGNGNSEGDFRQATITKEIEDLQAVLDAAQRHFKDIICLGHSMGGAVSTLIAVEDARVKALATLAGMIDTKKFAQTEFGDLTPDEDVMWEDEDCPLSSVFMKDLCDKVENVLPRAKNITIPWLLIHGSADDVVLPADTDAVEALDRNNHTIVRIEGANHVFDQAEHLDQVTTALLDWLDQR